jgi:DNA-binding NtrC family response regulator
VRRPLVPRASAAPPRRRVLVIDDQPSARGALSAMFAAAGYEVETAAGSHDAIDLLDGFAPHLVLADVELRQSVDAPLMAALRCREEPLPALMLLARRELVPAAIRGLADGADGYLTKPVHADRLRLIAERLIDEHRLRLRVHSMRSRLRGHPPLRRLIGTSPQIHAAREALAQAAESSAPVLIRGENGTGKLLAAELLHECRGREGAEGAPPPPAGEFVAVACDGLSAPDLAHALDRAGSGTLFFDEVSELPTLAQRTLADFLARRRGAGARVGRPRACVVAATSRDLAADAADFQFSGELLQLLRGIAVVLPPLRDRRSDIPLLADHFLRRAGLGTPAADPAAIGGGNMARLLDHRWLGNVAELKSYIERSSSPSSSSAAR